MNATDTPIVYTDRFVTDVRVDGMASTGPYGGKLRTRFVVRCGDGRARRVYAMSYGNAASLYLVVGGVDTFLGVDDEHALERHARSL